MASAFWTLEDGRGFARRWEWMAYMLRFITDELQNIKGAEEFHEYLEKFVFREENGDSYNGYGGFIRGNENIMFNIDVRSFAPQNRAYFWQATQRAVSRLKAQDNNQYEGITCLLLILLDMHKRIKRGEDPMLLNHFSIIKPDTHEKHGPGW